MSMDTNTRLAAARTGGLRAATDGGSPALRAVAKRVWPVAFLVVLTGVAHFALARNFGLYEDDYAFAGATLTWTAHDAWAWVLTSFGPGGQGRPLGFILGSFLPWLGSHLTGNFLGMYAIAGAVLAGNVVLFNAVLRRAAFPPPVPLLGAVAFCLFPADTTRPFLCHALILQPSMTCLLTATLLYQIGGRWRWAAYAVAVGSLLSYETAYVPFVAAPLLVPGAWDRRLPWRLARHAAVVVGILIVTFYVRRWTGEARAADTIGTIADLPARVAWGFVIGPGVALRQCGVRAAQMLARPATVGITLGATVPLAVAVLVASRRAPTGNVGPTLARGFAAAAALLVSAYALSFTHYPPDATYGRMTSVHMAAAPGAALLLAMVAYAVLGLTRRWAVAFYPIAVLVGLYLGALFAFAVSVQVGFAVEWQEQRTFWTRIVHLCPDATPGTTVLLQGPYLPESDYVLTQSWADHLVWDELFDAPPRERPFVDFGDLEQHLDWRDGGFRWARLAGLPGDVSAGDVLPAGRTILLRVRDFRMERVAGAVVLNGHRLVLKPVPAGVPGVAVPDYPRRPLYRLLIRDGGRR